MADYIVTWQATASGDSPHEAAVKARDQLREDPVSFMVQEVIADGRAAGDAVTVEVSDG